ncbi:PREDICTED: venom serine protease-like isoform X2 [Vollenhovia emeryi]|uniref:venom serine protease-like isoform X2 n=1 Tax=Vollenhovia emeryi TaxID=411798 RepID=UPI0005F4C407|nr:PREDICTED: venom serine protease-like isoform X2 [Vollenhovia emeryi]
MQAGQVVLFGLLLSLFVTNGGAWTCNYFQEMKDEQTYYVYNMEYPNYYKDENQCTWNATSPYNIQIKCNIEMTQTSGCDLEQLSFKFDNKELVRYCGRGEFVLEGRNPTVRFVSKRFSSGKFLCNMTTLHKNNDCKCGWRKTTRIVGGEETGVNEFPMMCGIVDAKDGTLYCGCTIISPEYVITAAHCVDQRDISMTGVVVGEHDTSTNEETKATKVFRLDECKIHSSYNGRDNDVALCKIRGTITYSQEVGPVCLPFQHSTDSFAGRTVTAAGWGLIGFAEAKAEKLRKVDLNVISLAQCSKSFSYVNDKNMCTYTRGKDTCQMDSGGPLLWSNPSTGNLVLAGITAAGEGCASDTPAVAMRTGAFIDWIVANTPGAKYCQIE